MVGPIIDELGTEYDGKVVVRKVDVDANQIRRKYGVKTFNSIDFS
jgi:thioredoxin 1